MPRTPRRRRWLTPPAAALLAAAALVVPLGAADPADAATATVTVDATQVLGTVPPTGQGVNVAVYDGAMTGAAIPGLLRSAGVDAVRYPGGSYSDIYHWRTNTADGGYVAPGTDFDTYMATVRAAGAQPVLIANYGSGTPQEAADWVRYANVTKGYGARTWEIGNEVYGNGHYGADWENDTHADSSPRAYATNALAYITAMKAVDPTIRVGVVLTTPGSWPDGIVAPGDTADWNDTVLSIVRDKADFGIVHWYPGASSAADSLGRPAGIAGLTAALRTLYTRYAGAAAGRMGIAVTETNPGYQLDSSAAALFAADSYPTWWENGVADVDWWTLHNGSGGTGTNEDGSVDWKDEGILATGGGGEPAANTPFPPYWGISMAGELGDPGDTLVRARSSSPTVSAHAARTADGGLDVMLVNRDPAAAATVSLAYPGYAPAAGAPVAAVWKRGDAAVARVAQGTAGAQTVPAYSVTVVHLRPAGTPTPTASPTASPSPSPTPSPTASPGAGGCAVSYRVTSSWGGGFTGEIAIRNAGTAAVTGWRLAFAYAGTQRITSAWNGVATQTGTAVTVTDAGYNATIPAGGSTTVGFQATYSGANPDPTAFTLNGRACTG